jgi:hypothetical protein
MRGSMEHLMWLKWKERTGLNLIDPRAENYGWNSIMLLNTTRNLIISGHIISGQRIVAANDHVISGHF